MVRLGALVVAVGIMAPLPATAYTQEDVNACMPDALRLCRQAMPDVGQVAHCLARKKRQLSSPCLAAFNRVKRKLAEGGQRLQETKLQETRY